MQSPFVGQVSNIIQLFYQRHELVRTLDGKDFAFIEFISAMKAREVVDRQNKDSMTYAIGDRPLSIGWAQGKPADKTSTSTHAGNCWFCLASPTVAVGILAYPCISYP